MLINPKSVDDIIALFLGHWKDLQPDINTNSDSMVYMDSAVMAQAIYMMQMDMINQANNSFLAFASGDELSNLGADRGVYRKKAISATGVIHFMRESVATTDFLIPAGTRASTQTDVDGRFVTFETIEDGYIYGHIDTPAKPTGTPAVGGAIPGSSLMHYKITAVDGNGVETAASPVESVSLGSSASAVDLTWTAIARAIKYKVYVASGIGNENSVHYLDDSAAPNFKDVVGVPSSMEVPPTTNETGATIATISAKAVLEGVSGNVGPNTITEFIDHPPGVVTLINLSGMTGGSDQESDSEYLLRIKEQLGSNTGRVTVAGIKNLAKNVPGVEKATVYLPYPAGQRNEVWVYIVPAGGGTASPTLVQEVQDMFDLEENHAPTVNITVKAAIAVPINVTVHVDTYAMTDLAEQATVRQNIDDAVREYINSVEVGGIMYAKQIENAVSNTTGVVDYTITEPLVNNYLDDKEQAISGVITIT